MWRILAAPARRTAPAPRRRGAAPGAGRDPPGCGRARRRRAARGGSAPGNRAPGRDRPPPWRQASAPAPSACRRARRRSGRPTSPPDGRSRPAIAWTSCCLDAPGLRQHHVVEARADQVMRGAELLGGISAPRASTSNWRKARYRPLAQVIGTGGARPCLPGRRCQQIEQGAAAARARQCRPWAPPPPRRRGAAPIPPAPGAARRALQASSAAGHNRRPLTAAARRASGLVSASRPRQDLARASCRCRPVRRRDCRSSAAGEGIAQSSIRRFGKSPETRSARRPRILHLRPVRRATVQLEIGRAGGEGIWRGATGTRPNGDAGQRHVSPAPDMLDGADLHLVREEAAELLARYVRLHREHEGGREAGCGRRSGRRARRTCDPAAGSRPHWSPAPQKAAADVGDHRGEAALDVVVTIGG